MLEDNSAVYLNYLENRSLLNPGNTRKVNQRYQEPDQCNAALKKVLIAVAVIANVTGVIAGCMSIVEGAQASDQKRTANLALGCILLIFFGCPLLCAISYLAKNKLCAKPEVSPEVEI